MGHPKGRQMVVQPLKAFFAAPTRRMTGVIILVNLFVCSLAAVSLHTSYELYGQRTAVASRNISRLMAESVGGDVQRIDLGLLAVRDEYLLQRAAGGVRGAQMTAFLIRLKDRLPMTEGLRVADAAGDVLYSSGDRFQAGISIADRDYFSTLRDDPAATLAIGKAVTSRITGRWVVPFARRLTGPDGRFEGVVVAPVTTDWFVERFSRLDVGPHGAVALRGDASRAFEQLARYPPTAGFVGQTTVSAKLHALFAASPEAGTYEADSGPDKVHRTHSYQRVSGYPLVAIVGLAREDWLNDWAHEVLKMASLVLAFAFTTVLGGRAVLHAWEARLEAQRRLQFLAYHDALTGLPNRALFQDRFHQARTRAERERSKVALLFVDLDQFKTINDSLGHQVGDQLLIRVGERLQGCLRESDTVSRQGGDEFLLLLPDLPEHGATAAPLLSVMNRMAEPFSLEGEELTTSVSVGIAIYPDDGIEFDTLAKKADMAMYRAKEAGRNTYRFFDEQMNVEAIEQLSMRNGLRWALERGEFVLHYQPQIELVTGAIVGAEALIRWQHPELGLVGPGRFIGVAEESRLIIPIGEWVLREACRQAVAWRRAGLPDLVVAVNLSAVQFRRGDVEQTVLAAIEASGHDPALLELEITESTLIENVEEVLEVVERLKRVGVRLSIDDFGTGYSSLSYLKRFNVDKLKVDQSFIRELTADANDAAIVKAVIQMGHSLNLRVIAEGVESAEALDYLRALQCDEVQGFHFARPMEPEAFAAYVRVHGAERGGENAPWRPDPLLPG
jgi:diguanylate cyclase (GGDEF)-like protein